MRIHWDESELNALAHEVAVGLNENKMGVVPSAVGNASFLKPLIGAAMVRALKPERIRPLEPSIGPVVKRFWDRVAPALEKVKLNGHAPELPPAPPPPPPPPPEKTLADFTDSEILVSFFDRILKAISTRQRVILPGVDEIRAGVDQLNARAEERDRTIKEFQDKLSAMGNALTVMKMDLGRFKPAPPAVFVLGAQKETQQFLRDKCDDAHLEVDFRFMEIAANARPIKADYAIMFGNVGHDWQEVVRNSVSKSHTLFVGGRHDAAMIQLKEWLK